MPIIQAEEPTRPVIRTLRMLLVCSLYWNIDGRSQIFNLVFVQERPFLINLLIIWHIYDFFANHIHLIDMILRVVKYIHPLIYLHCSKQPTALGCHVLFAKKFIIMR